jgi:rhamnosyltransferase
MDRVIILLAAYNGENYIAKQIESIINQDYKCWKLIISDDCSTDNTFTICKAYEQKDARILVIRQNKNYGALENFNKLIRFAKENYHEKYFMFSDQDDVWYSDKISSCKVRIDMVKEEIPLLLYTSKQYVDANLNLLNVIIKGEESIQLPNLLHQNMAYGCTMLFNDSLCDLINDIPKNFINHDHYIIFMAFFFGRIIFFQKKTLMYRQHSKNVSGNIYRSVLSKIFSRDNIKKNVELFFFTVDYCCKYINLLNEEERKMILDIRNKIIKNNVFISYYLYIYKVKKNTTLSTLNFYFEIVKIMIYRNITYRKMNHKKYETNL